MIATARRNVSPDLLSQRLDSIRSRIDQTLPNTGSGAALTAG